MNVTEIIRQALIEMDEDPADISDYDEKFRMYLNMGYQIIVRQYYKPRETYACYADKDGYVYLNGYDLESVIEMTDANGRHVSFRACSDGCGAYQTNARDMDLNVICQVNYPPLKEALDIPQIPEHAHYALVLYLCYRHLSSGNLAKQSRAQYYRQSFYEAANMIKPAGTGSVTKYLNFYSATD